MTLADPEKRDEVEAIDQAVCVVIRPGYATPCPKGMIGVFRSN